jgi:phospholipid transport system transporter-binding protein
MKSARIVAVADGRFRVEGVLDFSTVGHLFAEGRRLFSAGGPLDVDLGEVVQTNSAGLALLLEWLDLARRSNVSLRFRNLPESLARIAELTNLTTLLPIVADRA